MEILVDRFAESLTGSATIGRMSIDVKPFCYTLEDKVREVPGRPVSEWKIKGATAIPAGRYRVSMVFSPKHECMVPLVNDVPGFSAIEIHWGNTDRDTEGCLLVGSVWVQGADMIQHSWMAWCELMPRLQKAFGVMPTRLNDRGAPAEFHQVTPAEDVWITYQNNFPAAAKAEDALWP